MPRQTEPTLEAAGTVTRAETRRFLHVANGTSTTGTIEAAGIPGAVSIWADPLYEGPVPGGVSDAALVEVRARYLAGPAAEAAADPVYDLGRWRSAIEDHDSYDEVILWFEHDLFDQLNLIQLLSWIRDRVPPAKTVSLVCVGSFPGHAGFKGLGELTPDELASLLNTRERVTGAQYALAVRAWLAFREPTPRALDDLRRSDTSPLPFLAPALKRLFEEYPSTADGLSRTERRLLQLADAGPAELAAAFPRMHEGEESYYVTDLSFAALVDGLSRTTPPLIEVAPGARPAGSIPAGAMTITDAGRAVLNGRLDRVTACGIDRWIGGVHLQAGDLWRWDDSHQRMTKDAAGR
jgi:hypothetical protein